MGGWGDIISGASLFVLHLLSLPVVSNFAVEWLALCSCGLISLPTIDSTSIIKHRFICQQNESIWKQRKVEDKNLRLV